MKKNYDRLFLRAPLKTRILYEDDGYVFKAQTQNISEGGILLGQLPHVPEINLLPLMIDIPIYPDFQTVDMNKVGDIERLERNIVRVRAKIVRTFEEKSPAEQIFIPFIGCQFVRPDMVVIASIQKYVERFARNIVFLLKLFDSAASSKKDKIRFFANFLGYQGELHLAEIRQKILHDYRSLENL